MVRNSKKRRSRHASKSQENVSILSFTAICIAASLFKSVVSDCNAPNEN